MPTDLTRHLCLSHNHVGKSHWRFSRESETAEVDVNSRLSANDPTTLLQAALAGASMALLDFLVEQLAKYPRDALPRYRIRPRPLIQRGRSKADENWPRYRCLMVFPMIGKKDS